MSVSVAVHELTHGFPDDRGDERGVLDKISFEAKAGSFVLVRGRSGAGKSTLLNLIAGLLTPKSGEVVVGDLPVHALSEGARDRFRARHVGYVFQTFHLIPALTVRENLYLPLRLAGKRIDRDAERATAILDTLELSAHMGKKVHRLSVGQRQRVAVGRVLLSRPSLVLADEPTASLDEQSGLLVRDALFDLHREGATLFVASHDPLFAQREADLVVALEGKEAGA